MNGAGAPLVRPILLAALSVAMPAAAAPLSGAASCSGCHAPSGAGPVPGLMGRPASDIIAAMAAFRTGTRQATVMDRIARGFSDAEVHAIAEWLAAQRSPHGRVEP